MKDYLWPAIGMLITAAVFVGTIVLIHMPWRS